MSEKIRNAVLFLGGMVLFIVFFFLCYLIEKATSIDPLEVIALWVVMNWGLKKLFPEI